MRMPTPDAAIIARRAEIAAALRAIVPGEAVIETDGERRAYESDGLTAYRQPPLLAVLPSTTAEVERILRYCHETGVKVVPRGAGTSLSGGALPLADGIILGLGKFNRILDIDFANRCAVVQPGVTNLGITSAVQHAGFFYAPDPSSQIACTIGGNVAENSGGVHCLKYGVTTNNLLGIEMVLMNGEVLRLGGKHLDAEGYDLLGVMTGSEGLLGVVTEVTVRLLKKPTTARALLVGFPSNESAGNCVAEIIAAGIIPGGMEMMDKPAIHAAEDFVHVGYPRDVEALLIVELDGPAAEVDHLIAQVEAIARANQAVSCRISESEEERLAFWAGRKAAFPAVGRISPDYYCVDGTIPRKRLPEVLTEMRGAFREASAPRRQRLPCRRRQSPSAHPLRRERARRARARRGIRRRHPALLRRGRRRAHRRARRRRREARPDAGHVRRGRSRPPAAAQMCLRSRRPSQSRESLSAAASLRRARPHAYPSRPGAVPGLAALLR